MSTILQKCHYLRNDINLEENNVKSLLRTSVIKSHIFEMNL